MKKILTFAIVALLMGGFAINANAQENRTATKDKAKKEVVKDNKLTTQPKEDWDQVVKDYENAVDQCVSIYEKMQKAGDTDNGIVKEFNNALSKAEGLKEKLLKGKEQLNRTQADHFDKATKKLMKVYAKS